jgi:hypothetical protein
MIKVPPGIAYNLINKKMTMARSFTGLLISFVLVSFTAKTQQIYADAKTGKDSNKGTIAEPLKTINEAARRVKMDKEKLPAEIILKEGIYLLTETALFDNNKFTQTERLVIRAEIMPGDKEWTPQKMPVIVTMVPLGPGTGGEEAKGLQIEVSHVTIAGLRFTGSPNYSYKNEKEIRRSYPVWREGKNLDDLLVTQCLFAGDADVLPLHVGVIANGNGLVLDHCVFFNCKNPVVFWKGNDGVSYGNAMHYCLVYGCYFSGVWTTKDTNGDDFYFHHNIIANCKTAWMREKGSNRQYRIHDCIFTGNAAIAGFGAGPASGLDDSAADFLKMDKVRLEGNIRIEKDQSKINYLQLEAGSFGSDLKAGLFKK